MRNQKKGNGGHKHRARIGQAVMLTYGQRGTVRAIQGSLYEIEALDGRRARYREDQFRVL